MSHHWLGAVVAILLVLLAAAPFIEKDPAPVAPVTEVATPTVDGDSRVTTAAQPAGAVAPSVPDSSWQRVRTESEQALDAVTEATRDTATRAWEATREGTEHALRSTRDAGAAAWEATVDAGAGAWRETRDRTRGAWEATTSASRDAWQRGRALLDGVIGAGAEPDHTDDSTADHARASDR